MPAGDSSEDEPPWEDWHMDCEPELEDAPVLSVPLNRPVRITVLGWDSAHYIGLIQRKFERLGIELEVKTPSLTNLDWMKGDARCVQDIFGHVPEDLVFTELVVVIEAGMYAALLLERMGCRFTRLLFVDPPGEIVHAVLRCPSGKRLADAIHRMVTE